MRRVLIIDDHLPSRQSLTKAAIDCGTMTRTGTNEALRRSAPPDPILEIHRADARQFGIKDADFVEVVSRRGKVMV